MERGRAAVAGREPVHPHHELVEELNAAEQRGRALSTLDGQLIDNPHLALAERILSQARLINSKDIQRETNDKSRPYDE